MLGISHPQRPPFSIQGTGEQEEKKLLVQRKLRDRQGYPITSAEPRELKIPHPLIHERKFVLLPLNELNKDFVHPSFKINNQQLLNDCVDKSKIALYGY